MKTVLLSDPSTKYEAISYVWGTDVMDHLISVDGRKLLITKNLDAALRQVRRPDQARALWADSICINQKDNDEKGYQVALMGQIYETSRCTMVCLGVGQRLAEAEHARNVAILVDKVKEPKDRIYALIHLLTSGGTTLQPDYAATTSHLDVYRDFAIKYTEDKADLDLLNCVEHNQNTFNQETIPSWVPRWDVGGYPEPMLNPMDIIITGDTPLDYPAVQCVTVTDGGSALRVRAVVFDTVKYVSETIKRASGNRRLILLGRGHYAIAPELTREDDICVVIFGARRPFILRKVAVAGVDEFHYKLIGAAYVQSKHVHVKNEIPLALGEESAGDETYDWREYDLPTEDMMIH
ncbi:hypothetical protein SLS64_003133 [Diaporthe eres]